jgi:hypothetical protein
LKRVAANCVLLLKHCDALARNIAKHIIRCDEQSAFSGGQLKGSGHASAASKGMVWHALHGGWRGAAVGENSGSMAKKRFSSSRRSSASA